MCCAFFSVLFIRAKTFIDLCAESTIEQPQCRITCACATVTADSYTGFN